ncbi:MAG: hypothetical protein LUO89_04490, partial [Methanothrix sp.]|nr:hypothetical protein [Methanothrix sp.]
MIVLRDGSLRVDFPAPEGVEGLNIFSSIPKCTSVLCISPGITRRLWQQQSQQPMDRKLHLDL